MFVLKVVNRVRNIYQQYCKKIASLALSGAETGNQFTMPLLINVY